MQVPLEVTFKNTNYSDAVKEHIESKAEKLDQYSSFIISAHVIVSLENNSQTTGNLHKTHIIINVPQKELISSHSDEENLYVSIDEAFDKSYRQVNDNKSLHLKHTKDTDIPEAGHIARLFVDYGFIVSGDNEYYFNSSLLTHPHFDSLNIGDQVQFIPALGDDGPIARKVKVTHMANE